MIVTRSEWGARPPRKAAPGLTTDLATVHWEGPTMGSFPHAKCAGKVRTIQDFHMDTRGWNDIAYSAVVCPHGYVYEGRGRNARTGANGTNEGNKAAYAVCALVGVDDPQPPALHDGIAEAVAWLGCTRTNAHRDWKPTQCPGDQLARLAHSGRFLAAPEPIDPIPTPDPEDDMTPEQIAKLEALEGRVKKLEDGWALLVAWVKGNFATSKALGIVTAWVKDRITATDAEVTDLDARLDAVEAGDPKG